MSDENVNLSDEEDGIPIQNDVEIPALLQRENEAHLEMLEVDYYGVLENDEPNEEDPEEINEWEEESEDGSTESDASSQPDASSDNIDAQGSDDLQHYELSLTTRHDYLGATKELRGRTVIEDNEFMRIPLLIHSTLMNIVLMPNQTLPLSISHPLHRSLLLKVISGNKLIGIVHKELSGSSKPVQFGTIAEIYEHDDNEGTLSVKAKGRQRFRVIELHREITGIMEAKVVVLPEIKMPDPFYIVRSKSLQRMNLPKHFVDSDQRLQIRDVYSLRSPREWKARKRCAMLTPWPSWIYDQYDDMQLSMRLINGIETYFNLKSHTMQIPHDPQELSHWASINLPLNDEHKLSLLSLNTSTQRLRYLLSVVTLTLKSKTLCCNMCGKIIANSSNIFAMSLEGPQGTFVNPGGFVHEMFTISKAPGVSLRGRSSHFHSWFPGYAWTIANCSGCNSHVGWNFKSGKGKLKPLAFYGITRKSVKIKFEELDDPRQYII